MNIEITEQALGRLLRRLNDGAVMTEGMDQLVEQWAAVYDGDAVRLDVRLHFAPYAPEPEMTLEMDAFGRVKR